MAASTIAPMAIAIPPSDMMFDDRPSMRMGMKAITMEIGMVNTGMMALGKCHRKIMITMETTIISSSRVCFRLSMERRINSDRS